MKLFASNGNQVVGIFNLARGQNSLGEPGFFVSSVDMATDELKSCKGYEKLIGWPDYAVEQWLVDRGYKYIY